MISFSRRAYSVVSVLLLCELLAQFYFMAGLAIAVWLAADNEKSVAAAVQGADIFGFLHFLNGMLVIPVTMLVLVALSFASRYTWRTTGLTAVLLGLMIIQFLLVIAGTSKLTYVAGLHAVNAIALVGYTAWTIRRNWAFGPGSLTTTARAAGAIRAREQSA